MKMYLPEIYPDELVYSWLSRYFVQSGYTNHKTLISQLFYSIKNNPSVEFIGHINKEAEQQITQVYSMDDLILQHTMFPQYARFMTVEKRKMALAELKQYSDPHKVLTILPRNDKEKRLKYCPLCVAADRKKYGETYWHRIHQIRNMVVCPVHKCKLVDSEVNVCSEKIFMFNPAELEIKDIMPIFANNETLIGFSEYVSESFNMNAEETHVKAIIYNAMVGTKYMNGKQRNMSQFAYDLKVYFTEIGINRIASIYQIQKVMVGESREFSVICQIAYFLGISPNDLLRSKNIEEKESQERESHYVKNRGNVDWEKFDKQNVLQFERFCRGIYDGTANENDRPERISEKMICKFLGITSYGFKNLPECIKVYKKYAESYEESWARKIMWAYEKLKQEKDEKSIYWSDLRRLSGVKKKSIEKIEPYLDKEIFSLIVELIK